MTMEVEVFESINEESDTEIETIPEQSNEYIITDKASGSNALETFVTRNESLDAKISRIRREIEEIKNEASPSLLEELRNSIGQAGPPIGSVKPATPEAAPVNKRSESSPEFGELESRIARVETLLGTSARSPALEQPIAVLIKQSHAILELISVDPQLIRNRIEDLRKVQVDEDLAYKINWLYTRLHSLDSQISLVPHLTSRLQTLRFMHSETISNNKQISSTVSEIDAIHKEIEEWQACLKHLEGMLGSSH